ncbi:hypothetical protein GFS31_20950 [Leptolyngbya sp. BL0902]|nr:hypothetical protein GFS31_20950 [Leptolyngbya sp. BL0902]
MAHGAERLLRQGKTVLLWGVQVIAFPLYVAFQGVRSAARTLETTKPWQQVVALLTGEPAVPPTLTADAPIRALLSLTQPLTVREAGGLYPENLPENAVGDLLRQARVDSVIVADPWSIVPLSTPVCGLASDLATRHLVLVTANNVIFNGLTDLQREHLQRAITLLMAEYAGWCRRQGHNRRLRSPGLPLPQATENQWLPVRWANQALAWMQASPLAQVTNLFGEAQAAQWENQGVVAWWERAMASPGQPVSSDFPQLGATSDWGAALAMNPYPSIPVPYGVSAWAPSHDCRRLGHAEAEALVVAGSSAVATQPWATREVVTYLNEDGTVARANWAGHRNGDRWAGGFDDTTSPTLGWGNTGGEGADLKGLPGNDAIEAQVALVHYVDHPLVVVLRWLDALLHQAETWLQRAWQWLRGRSA